MDAQELHALFFDRLEHLSPQAEYELRHEDYVMEMPQSGERIRGREAMRAFQRAYPNPRPSLRGEWSVPATCGWSRAGRTTAAGRSPTSR